MIGDLLREEREKQNLTIKDIEKGTSIRALYIESIEKGEYGVLPGGVYTKGFIRNYANYLKLDAEAVLRQFNEEQNPGAVQAAQPVQAEVREEQPKEQPKKPLEEPRKRPAPIVRKPQRKPKETPAFSAQDDFHGRVEKSRRTQNAVLGVVAAAVVLGGAYFFLSGDDSAATTAKTQQPAATQSAAPAPAPEKKVFSDVEVSAKFTDRCWTKVVVDGKTEFEGTAEKGKTMSWKGKERVLVTAGNADAVEITYNGEDLGKIGAKGEVVEKRFTKDKAEDVK